MFLTTQMRKHSYRWSNYVTKVFHHTFFSTQKSLPQRVFNAINKSELIKQSSKYMHKRLGAELSWGRKANKYRCCWYWAALCQLYFQPVLLLYSRFSASTTVPLRFTSEVRLARSNEGFRFMIKPFTQGPAGSAQKEEEWNEVILELSRWLSHQQPQHSRAFSHCWSEWHRLGLLQWVLSRSAPALLSGMHFSLGILSTN